MFLKVSTNGVFTVIGMNKLNHAFYRKYGRKHF